MTPHSDYLNLGCGARFNTEWDNVNFNMTGPNVIAWDLKKGIPFPKNSFNVVYHSHLLEHFTKTSAREFLMECRRVLRPEGIIRVVVPDLESIARTYLKTLASAASGSSPDAANYEWILLEMYDQTVRNSSGGAMEEYLRQDIVENEEFVISRCGAEARHIRNEYLLKRMNNSAKTLQTPFSILDFRTFSAKLKRIPQRIREYLVKALLANDYEALNIGRFRRSGEIHQWMYDRFSLRELLTECGFTEIRQRAASDSYVPDWASFNLDTEPDGSAYKPDSLYMEAIKP